MKKSYFKYLILFSIIFLFGTCKKYQDGGYQRRGPKMIVGNWQLALYEVNGIDSTEFINYNGNDNYKIVSFFKDSYNYRDIHGRNYPIDYMLSFANNNEQLTFSNSCNGYENLSKFCHTLFSNNECFRLFFNPEGKETTWKILKLTKTEFILEAKGINSYKIKLRQR